MGLRLPHGSSRSEKFRNHLCEQEVIYQELHQKYVVKTTKIKNQAGDIWECAVKWLQQKER